MWKLWIHRGRQEITCAWCEIPPTYSAGLPRRVAEAVLTRQYPSSSPRFVTKVVAAKRAVQPKPDPIAGLAPKVVVAKKPPTPKVAPWTKLALAVAGKDQFVSVEDAPMELAVAQAQKAESIAQLTAKQAADAIAEIASSRSQEVAHMHAQM